MFENLKRRINLYRLMRSRDTIAKAMEKEFGPLQDPDDPDRIRVEFTQFGIVITDPKETEHLLDNGLWSSDEQAERVRDSLRSRGIIK